MYQILLAEDDVSLGYILKEYLELHGFKIQLVKDGEAAIDACNRLHFDVCILDVMLPKKDGFAVAFQIKQLNRKMPIIFLTARSLKVDKLRGFNIGADDYMVKPVDEEELIARIYAVLRRVYPETVDKNSQQLPIGKYVFDYDNQVLIFGDRRQFITLREAEILKLLYEHKGTILDRKQALKRLWGESDYFTRRSMDVFISKLRRKLRKDPEVKIVNIRGYGYKLIF